MHPLPRTTFPRATVLLLDDADITIMIKEHFVRLRRDPLLQNCLFWVFIEANMSYIDADRIVAMLACPNIGAFRAERDRKNSARFGVVTTQPIKEAYVRAAQEALVNGTLEIRDSLVGQNAQGDRQNLFKQLGYFRREIKQANDPIHGHVRTSYTGKMGGKKDDLAMALMINLFWSNYRRTAPSFLSFANEQGFTVY